MKIAAIADLHVRVTDKDLLPSLLDGVQDRADTLVLAGDLTDNGLPEEAEVLCEYLTQIKMPTLAVLGNHDHNSGQAEAITTLLKDTGVSMLNSTSIEIDQVGFVGTKGFCGGFNKELVQPFGEEALKTFIRTSIDEAVLLENALAKLNDCAYKVAVLHYSPIRETLEGENPELFPFLGTSRLANAIDRQGANVIFHGHAHNGSPTGRTAADIPVYNVSRFVLKKTGEQPYCVYDL